MRSTIGLMAASNKPIILHDLIEKRYALRPYGWPGDEVLLLVARLLVLGEIRLMMDGALLPIDNTDQTYQALTTPASRRKITIQKRQTTDPKAIQNARSLGKDLFHEMGPDGEDPLFAFLQEKLKGWQTSLNGYKPLADTGNYPGRDEIADGRLRVKKLLACDTSYTFIEQFNAQKADLLDLADAFHDLEHFYEHQRPTWEKLRKAHERFGLNRLELERDAQASPALKRMNEILNAASPYGLIREVDGLITAVGTANTALVAAGRQQAAAKIDGYCADLTRDIQAAGGDAGLRSACLGPLEALKARVQAEESLAHITQAEAEALKESDVATARIEAFARRASERDEDPASGKADLTVAVKKKRVVQPSKLVESPYLETQADVAGFLDRLRSELDQALARHERIEIR